MFNNKSQKYKYILQCSIRRRDYTVKTKHLSQYPFYTTKLFFVMKILIFYNLIYNWPILLFHNKKKSCITGESKDKGYICEVKCHNMSYNQQVDVASQSINKSLKFCNYNSRLKVLLRQSKV
jgi:hypothetical protein